MPLAVETSKTGKPRIEYGNHKYRESNVLKNGEVVWRCLGAKCKSMVKTNPDRTEVIEAKTTHTGPHPTTMRTLMSPRSQTTPKAAASVTPARVAARSPFQLGTPAIPASGASQLSGATEPTPTSDSKTPGPSKPPPENHSFEDILRENILLKKEIASLKNKYNDILNHSAENDMRLLQFTRDIFASPLSKERTDLDVSVNKTPTFSSSLVHQHTQTETLIMPPCQLCKILKEDMSNMISSIRTLENELASYRQQPSAVVSAPNGSQPNPYGHHVPSKTPCKDQDSDGFTTVRRKTKKKQQQRNQPIPVKNASKNQKYHSRDKRQNPVFSLPFTNVTILGDSHARHLAGLMGEMVPQATTVTGFCKPNAGLLDITPPKSSSPPPAHCYVILAGTNDVASGRHKVIFEHLEASIHRCRASSKVLVCTLPQRHDLDPRSPIHNTVDVVNHYIEELCSRLEGVAALNTGVIERRLFTSHGLHLRMGGKRVLASLIAEALTRIPGRQPTARRAVPERAESSGLTSLEPRTMPGASTFAEAVRGPPPSGTQPGVGQPQLHRHTDVEKQKILFF